MFKFIPKSRLLGVVLLMMAFSTNITLAAYLGLSSIKATYSPRINGQSFAAVANTDNKNISVYHVDTLTGALSTEVAGSPFAVDGKPLSVAFAPNNQFAAVRLDNGSVLIFKVNTTSGVFTPLGSPYPLF